MAEGAGVWGSAAERRWAFSSEWVEEGLAMVVVDVMVILDTAYCL